MSEVITKGCSLLVGAQWVDEERDLLDFFYSARQDTWRERLRAAWLDLRGKTFYHGIILTRSDAVRLGRHLTHAAGRRYR